MSDMLTSGRKHGLYNGEKHMIGFLIRPIIMFKQLVAESMLRMNASCMLVMTTTCMYKNECAMDELHVQE